MSANAIFKYPLEAGARQSVRMPRGARILCVQLQHSVPCLWALVETGAPSEERVFEILVTGEGVWEAERLDYIGTIQLPEGALAGGVLVLHVFERKGGAS